MVRLSIWRTLRATRREHWIESAHASGYTLVGGLAPLWIGLVMVLVYGGSTSILRFATGGEFTLYSASLMAPTIYIIVSERTNARLGGQATYMLIALGALLLSVAGYALVAPAAVGVIPFAGMRVQAFARYSIWLFVFCALFAFVVAALDNARSQPAVSDIARKQQNDLARDFDRLEE